MHTYGHDVSRTKTYHFNSLGFRGEEFNPDADFKLFVAGSSYAFGPGIDLEETWAYQLSQRIMESQSLPAQAMSLVNFSEGGASNNYTARMAVTQCSKVKPSLLVTEFVFKNRSEGFIDGKPFQVGPWLLMNAWQRLKTALSTPKKNRRLLRQRLSQVNHYYSYYQEEQAFIDTLKNILLVQSYCKAEKIPCMLFWTEFKQLEESRFTGNPVLAPLIAAIDKRCFCDFSITDEDIFVDRAADNSHPGPKSQQLFADKLMAFYERHYPGAAQRSDS